MPHRQRKRDEEKETMNQRVRERDRQRQTGIDRQRETNRQTEIGRERSFNYVRKIDIRIAFFQPNGLSTGASMNTAHEKR